MNCLLSCFFVFLFTLKAKGLSCKGEKLTVDLDWFITHHITDKYYYSDSLFQRLINLPTDLSHEVESPLYNTVSSLWSHPTIPDYVPYDYFVYSLNPIKLDFFQRIVKGENSITSLGNFGMEVGLTEQLNGLLAVGEETGIWLTSTNPFFPLIDEKGLIKKPNPKNWVWEDVPLKESYYSCVTFNVTQSLDKIVNSLKHLNLKSRVSWKGDSKSPLLQSLSKLSNNPDVPLNLSYIQTNKCLFSSPREEMKECYSNEMIQNNGNVPLSLISVSPAYPFDFCLVSNSSNVFSRYQLQRHSERLKKHTQLFALENSDNFICYGYLHTQENGSHLSCFKNKRMFEDLVKLGQLHGLPCQSSFLRSDYFSQQILSRTFKKASNIDHIELFPPYYSKYLVQKLPAMKPIPQNPNISRKRELSGEIIHEVCSTGTHERIKITSNPPSSGDFFTILIGEGTNTQGLIIDTGHVGKNFISIFRAFVKELKVARAVDPTVTPTPADPVVNILISHRDADHTNGVIALWKEYQKSGKTWDQYIENLEKYKVKVNIYFNRFNKIDDPVLAALFDGITCDGSVPFGRNKRSGRIEPEEITESKFYFSDYNQDIKIGNDASPVATFQVLGPSKKAFYCESKRIMDKSTQTGDSPLPEVFRGVTSANIVSAMGILMLTTSSDCDNKAYQSIFTGDGFPDTSDFPKGDYLMIKIPHHGSRYNNDRNMFEWYSTRRAKFYFFSGASSGHLNPNIKALRVLLDARRALKSDGSCPDMHKSTNDNIYIVFNPGRLYGRESSENFFENREKYKEFLKSDVSPLCRKYNLIIAKDYTEKTKLKDKSVISLEIKDRIAKITVDAANVNRDYSVVANNVDDLKFSFGKAKENYEIDEFEYPLNFAGEPNQWNYFMGCIYHLITSKDEKCTTAKVKDVLKDLKKDLTITDVPEMENLLRDGKYYFQNPPRLINMHSYFNNAKEACYHVFTNKYAELYTNFEVYKRFRMFCVENNLMEEPKKEDEKKAECEKFKELSDKHKDPDIIPKFCEEPKGPPKKKLKPWP